MEKPIAAPEPRFFATPKDFRAWLKTHHAKASALLVGYHKVHTVRGGGKSSMTWARIG